MKQLSQKYSLCGVLFLERLIQTASEECDFATGFNKGVALGWDGVGSEK